MRRPLLAPAVGLAVGVAVGLTGRPFPPRAAPVLALALAPSLAPAAFAVAGWRRPSSSGSRRPRRPPRRRPSRAGSSPRPTGSATASASRYGRSTARWWMRSPADGVAARARRPGAASRPRCGSRPGRETRGPPTRRSAPGAGGVALQAIAEGPVTAAPRPARSPGWSAARERFAEAADRGCPPREAALVRAIGTGDRAALDRRPTTPSPAPAWPTCWPSPGSTSWWWRPGWSGSCGRRCWPG